MAVATQERRKATVKLPDLHMGGQHQAFYDPHRFKVLICGRRWGKSLLAAVLLITCAMRGGIGWWVWPSFPMAMTGWRMLIRMLEPMIAAKIVKVDRQERIFHFPGGGLIQLKSAERPNSLRGEGLDLVVVDEWSYIKKGRKVFESDLRPALAEKQGDGFLITSPNGQDHAYEYFHLAKEEEEFASYQFPTWTNPFVPKEEIEVARKSLVSMGSEDVFRQEYGAEFLEDAAAYFTNMAAVMVAEEQQEAKPGHWYRMGIDAGRFNDTGVITIADGTDGGKTEVCYIEKIVGKPFTYQVERALNLADRFNVEMACVDATGFTYGFYEMLADKADFNVIPVTYTNKLKIEMFESLRTSYETGKMTIPDMEWLKVQHQMMRPEVSPGSLTVRLNAREGFNDDGPNSLALVNKAMRESRVTLGVA